jgi:transcriptional regulator with XRE-family HTH domain
MSNTSLRSTDSVGSMLRAWRTTRGKSQLELSMMAGVSSRHLSFVETGKSMPSREMVLTLSDALAVPLRERNAILHAAGFAPMYQETPLEGEALSEVRRALSHILDASEPNPTLVVNRRYDILMANEAALRLIEFFAPAWKGKNNGALIVFDETGLKPALANWAEICTHVVHRLLTELAIGQSRTPDDERMFARAKQIENDLRHERISPTRPPAILVPIQFRRDGIELDMFTTITTLGTPLDITLHELRIETLFPANEAGRKALAEISRRANDHVES